jgi:heme-degrading monooxygenase HmoA
MTSIPGKAKLARVWRGRTLTSKADEYQSYLLKTGIAPLAAKGALAVQMFRDDRDGETEFMTISYWESLKAMKGGSSDDPRQPHHLDRDQDFLIELPQTVQILKILDV